MGAMTSLNLASNEICWFGTDGIKAISSALKVLAVILVPFLSLSDHLTSRSTAGVCYYPQDMRALTKLDISSNNIAAAQGEDLQRICAASGIELAK
jgi:hypothetical protein